LKNSDFPAHPLTGDAYSDFEQAVNRNGGYNPECQGLTKREAFAMAAMQGLIANHTLRGGVGECAKSAIGYADALLAELDK